MIPAADSTWHEANQRYLTQALAGVRAALERLVPAELSAPAPVQAGDAGAAAAAPEEPAAQPAALQTLCSLFEISPFERNILLMCAGAEMDSRFAALYARAHNDARRGQPTFSLALAAFPDGHWSALTPARPLRFWHLLDVLGGDSLTASPLRIQERILHYLAGVNCLDERLQGLVKPIPAPAQLAPSQHQIADQMAAMWSQSPGAASPILELCGAELTGKRAIAAAACAMVGLGLHAVTASGLPQAAAEMEAFLRLWEREAILTASALLLECDDTDSPEGPIASAIAALMETIGCPLIVLTRGTRRCAHRAVALFEVQNPTPSEQADLWRGAFQGAPAVNGEVEALASQFSLSSTAIHCAVGRAGSADQDGLAERLWDACRVQARPRLEGLAQRIDSAAGWDDLVLPEPQKQVLSQIAIHVRHRSQVYHSWGFASRGTRGLGISALFAGPSGTGKTMAAEVLAAELRLDLYRIDLSQVVSKYIGETEKNLRRVFDAADEGAAILLFDEADALFGKRSEVKDSHDRYANVEVSYLLQRMETYRGLAILTTNRKSALDQAFLRRIRFVVEFPFPEAAQRAEIWRRVFPRQTPTVDLKIDRLARLSAAGGNIRNIALSAAFLAASEGAPVRMAHLLRAARGEFTKLEKPLTDVEVAGWV